MGQGGYWNIMHIFFLLNFLSTFKKSIFNSLYIIYIYSKLLFLFLFKLFRVFIFLKFFLCLKKRFRRFLLIDDLCVACEDILEDLFNLTDNLKACCFCYYSFSFNFFYLIRKKKNQTRLKKKKKKKKKS